MTLSLIFYRLRATKWRLYFKPNGPREWMYINFIGFREQPSDLNLCAQWIGTTNTGDMYYTTTTIDSGGEWRFASKESRANWMRAKEEICRQGIERFLDPSCRCRVGYHWKCPIHRTWVN